MNKKLYGALFKKAVEITKSFDLYPIIPCGDLSIEFIEEVFEFNPYYVFEILKSNTVCMLAEYTNNSVREEELLMIYNEVYKQYENFHKQRILKAVISDFRNIFSTLNFTHKSYMTLRPVQTIIIYYSFCIYYMSRDIGDKSGLKFARAICECIKNIKYQQSDNSYLQVKKPGFIINLPEFERDIKIYIKLKDMINKELQNNAVCFI